MSKSPLAALPFRPVSLDDFYRYAKSLSRLIDEPPQPSQQLLAKAYGYSDLHELQGILERQGDPGPFEWESRDTYPYAVDGLDERRERLLRLVAEKKGVSSPKWLKHRYSKVVDLGLFDTPPRHRAARKRVLGMLDVLEGEPVTPDAFGPHRGISAYAKLATTSEGETYAQLTALGAAVRDATDEVFDDWTRPEPEYEEQRRDQRRRALKIFNAHPDCPWPLAELITSHARALGQGSWIAPLWHPKSTDTQGEFIYPVVNEQFKKDVVSNAKSLLPEVIKAVNLFEPLYEGVTRYAPESYTPHDYDRLDYDTRTWSQLLYWGGKVAANAGELAYAVTLLKRVHRMKGTVAQHWAEEPLAALTLDEGFRSVMGCFTEDRFYRLTPWQCLAFAASSYTLHATVAASYFVQAMFRSAEAIEVFNEDAPVLAAMTSYARDASPSRVQEFMFLSAKFWKRNPITDGLFRRLAREPGVLGPVLEWNRLVREEPIVNYALDPRFDSLQKKAIKAAEVVAHAYAR